MHLYIISYIYTFSTLPSPKTLTRAQRTQKPRKKRVPKTGMHTYTHLHILYTKYIQTHTYIYMRLPIFKSTVAANINSRAKDAKAAKDESTN